MMQMYFSLRYASQLRRTRPELVGSLENAVNKAMSRAGAEVRRESRMLTASYDDTAIAFWLELVTALEAIQGALKKALPELYGYACLIREAGGADAAVALRLLSAHTGAGGLYCDARARSFLETYLDFGEQMGEFTAILGCKAVPESAAPNGALPLDPIVDTLRATESPCVALVGPEFCGKRESVRRFYTEAQAALLPYVVRFGVGGQPVFSFVHGFKPLVSSVFNAPEQAEFSLKLRNLSAQRLRVGLTDPLEREIRGLLQVFIAAYGRAAAIRGAQPILVLENLEAADVFSRDLAAELGDRFTALPEGRAYLVSTDAESMETWKGRPCRVLRFSASAAEVQSAKRLTGTAIGRDLWEIAYALYLLRPFFTIDEGLAIFYETGRTPETMQRALDLLAHQGFIGAAADPQVRIDDFDAAAQELLGQRAETIRAFVRAGMLRRYASEDLLPCFSLLQALKELGWAGDDDLALEALIRDVAAGTSGSIEAALDSGTFGAVVGEARSETLEYIYRTSFMLAHGSEEGIRNAFLASLPKPGACPRYTSYLLANQAIYHLGTGEIKLAAEKVKEAILLIQDRPDKRGLSRAYRLFALVSFAGQHLNDAIDYLGFALEIAEQTGDREELALVAYYFASVQFLHGNLAKAERLARQAYAAADSVGMESWAWRARFLEARLRLEGGRYREARGMLENIKESGPPEAEQLSAAWIRRTQALDPAAAPAEGAATATIAADDALFQVESAYLERDYPLAAVLADQALAVSHAPQFTILEQPDWSSGFSQCELFLFPDRDFCRRLLVCYRALAISRVANQKTAEMEEAVRSVQRIVKDERIPESDPYDAFYSYAYYEVLQKAGASELDKGTALSIAFKKLQRRASRIDETETKRSYLFLNHWHAALSAAAKLHNLI